jgi:hypothetical protein
MAKRYGLSKRFTRKASRDFVDFDYVHKLTPQDADWLSKFSQEYYQGDYVDDADNVHPPTFKLRLYAADNSVRHRVDLSTEILIDPQLLPDKADGKDK